MESYLYCQNVSRVVKNEDRGVIAMLYEVTVHVQLSTLLALKWVIHILEWRKGLIGTVAMESEAKFFVLIHVSCETNIRIPPVKNPALGVRRRNPLGPVFGIAYLFRAALRLASNCSAT